MNQDSNLTFPPNVYSRLASWVSSSREECLTTSKNAEKLMNTLDLDFKSFTFFKATIERESGIIIAAVIIIFYLF